MRRFLFAITLVILGVVVVACFNRQSATSTNIPFASTSTISPTLVPSTKTSPPTITPVYTAIISDSNLFNYPLFIINEPPPESELPRLRENKKGELQLVYEKGEDTGYSRTVIRVNDVCVGNAGDTRAVSTFVYGRYRVD